MSGKEFLVSKGTACVRPLLNHSYKTVQSLFDRILREFAGRNVCQDA